MIFFILVLKGIILGCTAIIPGISIGTMALVLNVYEKAIDGFTSLLTLKNWNKNNIIEIILFFLPLAIGMLIAMVALATLLKFLLDTYPAFVQISFMGVIVGSIPHIYKMHIKEHIKISSFPYIVIGIAIILFFSFSDFIFPQVETNKEISTELTFSITTITMALMFGTISSACGLIPGISGSFVLLILGYYSTYLTIVKELNIPLLIPLFIGHVLGLIVTAIILKSLLHKFATQSYSVIFGLVLASIIGIFPWSHFSLTFLTGDIIQNIFAILIGLGSFIFGVLLSRLSIIKPVKVIV